MEGDSTLENEYTRIVITMGRENSILPSSNRWYLETQNIGLINVSDFSDVLSSLAFLIPFYKLLDVEETQVANYLYPIEIEK